MNTSTIGDQLASKAIIRNFMYLDAEKLRSFSAQLLGGVPESGTKENGHEFGGGGKAEAGLLRLVKAEGSADYRYHRTSTETRSLHHQVYALFEDALSEEGLLESVDGTFNYADDWTPGHFPDGTFVKLRGRVRLVDYARNMAAMEAFPKLLKAFKVIQMINIKTAADSGEITAEEATAQRRALNETEISVKNTPIQELSLLGQTLYSEGTVRVKVHPSGAPTGFAFAGNGEDSCLVEPLGAGGLTQSPPGAEWVSVGQVSAATESSLLQLIPTGNGMEDAVETMSSHFRELVRTGSGALFPALEFNPLAVYREVRAS